MDTDQQLEVKQALEAISPGYSSHTMTNDVAICIVTLKDLSHK